MPAAMTTAERPVISVIAAMARNRVIGRDNSLPWHLPADLRRFKALTMGKPMIMGRRTWESLPGLLPGRRHIVVTRNRDYEADGADIAHSLDDAISLAGDVAEVMIVGGARLYEEALPIANRIHLTLINAEVNGDAFFPEIDEASWTEISGESHEADDKNPFGYRFVTLERSGQR